MPPIVWLGAQPLRSDGNDLIVTLPDAWVDRLGLSEGDYAEVSIDSVHRRGLMSPELREAFERVWQENEAGFRYLADHD